MIFLIYYVLAVYGASWLLTQSTLFASFREFLEDYNPVYTHRRDYFQFAMNKVSALLHCIVCTSVWVSFLFTLLLKFNLTSMLETAPDIIWTDFITLACISISSTWFLAQTFDDTH